MRIAILGAFPFPVPQGSQIYVGEQVEALRAAGADPELVTYEPGLGPVSAPGGRSGPSLAKPFADAALGIRYLRRHRRRPFDVALAHNAEAAVVGILVRPFVGVPVVYVAHTILRHELSSYAPAGWSAAVDPLGRGIDRFIASRADGIVALSDDAKTRLVADARCPIEVIPPGCTLREAPSDDAQRDACRRAGVTPGRFVLYTGNLDGYQDLALLDATAATLQSDAPVLVATHDARDGTSRFPHLKIREYPDFDDIRALSFAAGVLVLTRRRPGGFPIKLLNYMETGRPIVAFDRIAPGLEHGVSACLLDDSAGAAEIAADISSLLADPERSARLGARARDRLETEHAWPRLADRTLGFVARALARSRDQASTRASA